MYLLLIGLVQASKLLSGFANGHRASVVAVVVPTIVAQNLVLRARFRRHRLMASGEKPCRRKEGLDVFMQLCHVHIGFFEFFDDRHHLLVPHRLPRIRGVFWRFRFHDELQRGDEGDGLKSDGCVTVSRQFRRC